MTAGSRSAEADRVAPETDCWRGVLDGRSEKLGGTRFHRGFAKRHDTMMDPGSLKAGYGGNR